MAVFEIPLIQQDQSFNIDLSNVNYNMDVTWNSRSNLWELNLYDGKTNADVLKGIPLVANIDLFAPYGYLNLGGQLFAKTDGLPNDPPNHSNLGLTGRLFYITP